MTNPEIMGTWDIAFPHLHIYLSDVPKSFTILGFEIAMYGVMVTLGFLCALVLILQVAKRTGQNPDLYWDWFFAIMITGIIGARLYYVIFDWNRLYKDNPLAIFNLRDGGLAIYGGIIAGLVTTLVFARLRKVSFLKMGDTVCPGLLIGQVIGRYGNFTNREAFGQYTDNLFAMRIPIRAVYLYNEITESHMAHVTGAQNYIQVHPTFLYESLWNLVLLILILLYYKRRQYDGQIILFTFGGYAAGRMWIEGLRTDQLKLHYSGLPVSQMLAILVFCFCLTCLITVAIRRRK